jgi:hypothetical protein
MLFLAALYCAQGRYVEAEPLMRRSVVILLKFTRLTGYLHPSLRVGFFNYFSFLTGLSLSQEEIFKHLDELGQEAGLDSEGYGKLRQRNFEQE